MQEEIEIKLSLAPEHLNRFRRHGLLRSLAQDRARTHHLVSTYFDTPELMLRRKGAALRVRQKDGKGHVQSFKVRSDANAGTAKRYQEHETELKTPRPDLSLISFGEREAMLPGKVLDGELRPVFVTDFRRRVLPVRLADAEIEVALDVGEVRYGGKVSPICEAELELKSGHPARLSELALALHESLPMRLELRTKAARGYGLAAGLRPVAVKAVRGALKRRATLAEAIPVLIRDCLTHMLANEPVVVDGTDPEGVHQMRVGLRRLRALIGIVKSVMAPEIYVYLRDELRWLQQQLGPARDWDVFIAETLGRLAAREGPGAGLGKAMKLADEARGRAYDTARAAVGDPRFTAILLRTEVWLDNGAWMRSDDRAARKTLKRRALAFARAALSKRAAKVEALGSRYAELPEAELHQLRIAAKKLRYTAEFFQSYFKPRRTAPFIESTREIQDVLGTLNDAVVGRTLIAELLDHAPSKRARKSLERIEAMVSGWNYGRIEGDLARFPRVWQRYGRNEHFWES